MTLAPTYEAIKRETSGKPSIKEKPAELLGTGHQCKDGLLPSINSSTAMDGRDHPLLNYLCSTVVSCRIFIHSQSLIAG
jgi:hypothetical protein